MLAFLAFALADQAPKTPLNEYGTLVFLLDRYGIPVLVVAVLCWTILRTAKWLAPRIDRLVDRHDRLVNALESELVRQGEVLVELAQNQREVVQSQAHILECLRDLKRVARHE